MQNYATNRGGAKARRQHAPARTGAPQPETDLEPLATLFKALADPARLRVLNLLAQGSTLNPPELSHRELEHVTGFGPSKVSRHVAMLRLAGLVRERREGLWRYCALNPAQGLVRLRLQAVLEALPTLYGTLAADAAALRALRGGITPAAGIPVPEAHAPMARRPAVLFLCLHNAARSQMAEALLRHHAGDAYEVHSAGLEPETVHPLARQVLAEAGVLTRGLRSKHVRNLLRRVDFDHVITLCHEVEEECPRIFPGVGRVLQWPQPDAAAVHGTEPVQLAAFRKVRDRIDGQIRTWLKG